MCTTGSTEIADHLISGHMNAKNKYDNNGWLYVIPSRVLDINGLHLLSPLSINLSKYILYTRVNCIRSRGSHDTPNLTSNRT